MMKSLWIAKTGLSAQQAQLDVISNNLANVSTSGFKRSRAVFEDLMYQSGRSAGAQSSQQTQVASGLQLGTGVRGKYFQQHVQGTNLVLLQPEVAKAFPTPEAVNDALRVRRATAVRARLQLEASLESRSKRGRSLNLINFLERSVSMAAARQRTKGGEGGTYQLGNRTVRKALQLRFKIRRTGPKKVIEGAFIGNKGRTVFIREGASRLPIKALQTIDVAQMFNTQRINAKVVQLINTRFPAIFANDARFYTLKFGQR